MALILVERGQISNLSPFGKMATEAHGMTRKKAHCTKPGNQTAEPKRTDFKSVPVHCCAINFTTRFRAATGKTVGRRDAAVEPTGTYSRRVLPVAARNLVPTAANHANDRARTRRPSRYVERLRDSNGPRSTYRVECFRVIPCASVAKKWFCFKVSAGRFAGDLQPTTASPWR